MVADASSYDADASSYDADASSHDAADVLSDAAPASPDASGGPCTYDEQPGVITITSIADPAGPLEAACPNAGKHVAFTFTPDDDAAGPVPPGLTQLDEGVRKITIGDGKDPPNACLAPLGIVVGAKFPAKRHIEKAGGCSPLLYEVSVDLSSCAAQCG